MPSQPVQSRSRREDVVVFVWILECPTVGAHSFVGSVWSSQQQAVTWLEQRGGCQRCTVTMAELDNPHSIA